jgi:hypothetical protein
MIGGSAGLDDTVQVPIILSNGSNIMSFEGLITFDSNRLSFSRIQWSSSVANFTIYSHVNNGELHLVGAASSQDGNAGTFATMFFVNHQASAQTEITFSRLRWNEGPVMQNVAIATVVTGVDDKDLLPTEFSLEQNYPNPFNPSTVIEYAVPEERHVKLEVYNVLGERVAALVDEAKQAGYYSERFDATGLASGLYFYRLQAGDFVDTKRLLLLK